MMMGRIGFCIAAGTLAILPLWGYKSGPDPGLTGAPGEGNCTSCHIGTALNGGGGSVKVELVGATHYTPGLKHTLRVTVTQAGVTRWGFQLSARLKGTTTAAGAFSLADAVNTRMETAAGGLQYVTHTEAGTQAGTPSPASWNVEWTAPAAGAGPVVFYVTGNATNRDGAITGDRIYTSSAEYQANDGVPVETKSYALPQIAFGGNPDTDGRWTTTLYFTNTDTNTASFTVDFYANNGSPMAVPVSGGTSTSIPVQLAGGATTQIQLASTAALTQGWASVKLPTSVKGFGIFKQTVTGRSDSEAVIPMAEDSKQNYVMVWDDEGYTTVMAIANPGDTPAAVNLTVRLANGNQLGTGTVILGPKEKTAFILRTQLNLPAMQGAKGSMDISAASGKLSVLGLRFGPEAVTSMPPAEK